MKHLYSIGNSIKNYPLVKFKFPTYSSRFKVDRFANNFLSQNELDLYTPCSKLGDGNCFYRSVSLCIYGTEDFHVELRLRCLVEMIFNSNLYMDNIYLNSQLQKTLETNEINDLVLHLATMAQTSRSLNDDKEVFLNEFKRISGKDEWGTTWLFFPHANALGVDIQQHYPVFGSNSNTIHLKILRNKIRCLNCDKKTETINILWSNTINANSDNWIPNHFVSCLKKVNLNNIIESDRLKKLEENYDSETSLPKLNLKDISCSTVDLDTPPVNNKLFLLKKASKGDSEIYTKMETKDKSFETTDTEDSYSDAKILNKYVSVKDSIKVAVTEKESIHSHFNNLIEKANKRFSANEVPRNTHQYYNYSFIKKCKDLEKNTVEPPYNEPSYNEILFITKKNPVTDFL
ncbi:Vertnin [Brachionus plicatilis]|uniref:Vertnin n=1 Tax=Brachionus plicatilis TaxID=10195 RepID=A0A3M7RBS2_BRAPC|nr:Vertnin [Brachionus plicatilis]